MQGVRGGGDKDPNQAGLSRCTEQIHFKNVCVVIVGHFYVKCRILAVMFLLNQHTVVLFHFKWKCWRTVFALLVFPHYGNI